MSKSNGTQAGRKHNACAFFKLPADLRNTIYRYTIVLVGPIDIVKDNVQSLYPSLLRVCSQTRSEATNIFYGENTFRITDVRTLESETIMWLENVVRENARYITSFTVAFPLSTEWDQIVETVTEVWTSNDYKFCDHEALFEILLLPAGPLMVVLKRLGVPLRNINVEIGKSGKDDETSAAGSALKIVGQLYEKLLARLASDQEVLSG